MSKRATIYFEEELHHALRLKAADSDRSMSDLVNEAVRQSLAEDFEDLAAFADRVSEPVISFDEVVRRLKRDGKI